VYTAVRRGTILNEQDKEYLEALYAGFALAGYLMNGDYSPEEIPGLAKRMAKRMLEEEPDEGGIVAIKPRKRYERKKDN
jgi:hypothetical protein